MPLQYHLIFTEEELARMRFLRDHKGTYLVLDLHDLSVKEAKRLIRHVILLYRHAIRIRAVHGYNGGTSLKECLADGDISKRIVRVTRDCYNPGLTYLDVNADPALQLSA